MNIRPAFGMQGYSSASSSIDRVKKEWYPTRGYGNA